MLEQIRMSLVEYLAQRLTAAELARRLPDGWELDEAGDSVARRLTLKAMGYLAEFQRGDRTDAELWAAIRDLLSAPGALRTATSIRVQQAPRVRTRQSAGVGRTPQEEFA
jgi:hypothetical protein